jgi:hypothetical protein
VTRRDPVPRPPRCIVGSCANLGEFYRRVSTQDVSMLVRVCRGHSHLYQRP